MYHISHMMSKFLWKSRFKVQNGHFWATNSIIYKTIENVYTSAHIFFKGTDIKFVHFQKWLSSMPVIKKVNITKVFLNLDTVLFRFYFYHESKYCLYTFYSKFCWLSKKNAFFTKIDNFAFTIIFLSMLFKNLYISRN